LAEPPVADDSVYLRTDLPVLTGGRGCHITSLPR
jgi:hypothetical protein